MCPPHNRDPRSAHNARSKAIDSELRLVAALRRYSSGAGRPLPPIDVTDALLDERREADRVATARRGNFTNPDVSS